MDFSRNDPHRGIQPIRCRIFADSVGFLRESAALLRTHLKTKSPNPQAVMLSGGRTPVALYREIAAHPFPAPPTLHLLLSDERLVPPDSPESNQGLIAPVAAALNIPPERILGVRTELAPEAAARDYGHRVASFLDAGGHISLALLGLGSDGHTASLFSVQDMEAAQGRTAIAVHRDSPPHRVSLTPDILARCRKVVFLVAGEAKTDIVHRILQAPDSVVAAQAVRDAPDVELWFLKNY